MDEVKPPVTAVIVGGGHRSFIYGRYAVEHPDRLKIVGIADPDATRREAAVKAFGISPDRCYHDAEELSRVPRFADAVINGTMDKLHVPTSIPLLELGYDMLLEKPFCLDETEMRSLMDVVDRTGAKVMICHVLRYSAFYRRIKQFISSGELGDVLDIRTAEYVSYSHMSTAYVRGKWSKKSECGTSMLLAKCCHDIDVIMWLLDPALPVRVSSVGSQKQFRPENAPAGSGTRCTLDCPIEKDCEYSARKLYLDFPEHWKYYTWDSVDDTPIPDEAERERRIRYTSPYGRCIYKCGNDVVDHQSVLMEFDNGVTATHSMIGGTARGSRLIHVVGTNAELFGDFDANLIRVRYIDPSLECGYRSVETDLSEEGSEDHGGGDLMIVEDFVDYVRGDGCSVSCTRIEKSIAGHLCVFLADRSMESGGRMLSVDVDKYL